MLTICFNERSSSILFIHWFIKIADIHSRYLQKKYKIFTKMSYFVDKHIRFKNEIFIRKIIFFHESLFTNNRQSVLHHRKL